MPREVEMRLLRCMIRAGQAGGSEEGLCAVRIQGWMMMLSKNKGQAPWVCIESRSTGGKVC